ncbi:MAG: undecaprenyl/decaprenyl-phosphate alpha-N-acetylglucosaminyl 1-phosphate transferase [Planctomycetes bacterium]|nr:undecaprenyl/decaprenyl-phosphate alpha-N-acetylglucosaminyl 1-phosphate transferase [Planctomycetota bacterium]
MLLDRLAAHLEVVWGFAVALAIVLVLTPGVARVARHLGVVDEPGGRRINTKPIPRLGGLAMFLGVIVPALAFLDLDGEVRGLVLGAAVATTVGAIDDFRGLRWWVKLGGQLAAAGIAVGSGIWIDHFTFPFVGVRGLPEWGGMPLTFLWIVAIMNMINFLDGLDGLAAGVCGISGASYTILALSLGKIGPAILAAIVFGACLGFLRHNFYPARIFMGDSGAMLLGFLLAGLSVSGLFKTASIFALLFPLVILAVPIIDTSFVVARRLKHGEPVYRPDRGHLHHRFVNIGFSQRRTALTVWAWCASLAAAALATRFVPFRDHGEWHLWPTVLAAAIGGVALAFSVYVVYLLEIVKLASPLLRRRDQRAEPGEARRSA